MPRGVKDSSFAVGTNHQEIEGARSGTSGSWKTYRNMLCYSLERLSAFAPGPVEL